MPKIENDIAVCARKESKSQLELEIVNTVFGNKDNSPHCFKKPTLKSEIEPRTQFRIHYFSRLTREHSWFLVGDNFCENELAIRFAFWRSYHELGVYSTVKLNNVGNSAFAGIKRVPA